MFICVVLSGIMPHGAIYIFYLLYYMYTTLIWTSAHGSLVWNTVLNELNELNELSELNEYIIVAAVWGACENMPAGK